MGEEVLARMRGPGTPGGPTLDDVLQASYRRLVVQLYGVAGDLAEAEDVVQEAFVRAALAGRRFRGTDNPEAWLRRTAINQHRSRWRRLRNLSRTQHRLANPTDPPGLEERVVVIEALRTLPEPQRQVLALFSLADLSVEEIAATLGVAEGTVTSRLGRGREATALVLGQKEGRTGRHEQPIRGFVDRAEAAVELPDLATLEGRARERRRAQLATLAVTAVAVGAVVVLGVFWPDADPAVPEPKPDASAVVLSDPVPDRELATGREYTVPVYGQKYARTIPEDQLMVARFTVGGRAWLWYGDVVAKYGPGGDPDTDLVGYAAYRFSLVDRVATTQCHPESTQWEATASTPLGIARQIASVPGVEVVEEPVATERYGYPAARVQLAVPRVCKDSRIAVLWSVFPSSRPGLPGVGTVFLPGQRLDLWILDVQGSMVVVSLDRTPGLPRPMLDELQTIADSFQFGLVAR